MINLRIHIGGHLHCEKFAYIDLCRVALSKLASEYYPSDVNLGLANISFTQFSNKLMTKLYCHMEISEEGKYFINFRKNYD